MTLRERSWFAVFVLVVFVAGVSTGWVAHTLLEPRAFAGAAALDRRPPRATPVRLAALMRERLNLSPEQQKQVEGILRRRRESMAATHEETRRRVEDDIAAINREIEAVLTDAQRAEFNEMIKEFGRGLPPPPGLGPREEFR